MLTLKLLLLIFVSISADITLENETLATLPQWQELECEVIDEIYEKLNLKTFPFQPGHKYLFSETTLPWLEAKDECELYGGWLVHSVIFPRGVVHRVENGWGLTKMAVVLLNGLLW